MHRNHTPRGRLFPLISLRPILMAAAVVLSAAFPAAGSAGAAGAGVTRAVPADFPTIQGAIDAAGNGDTIVVAPGLYRERINFKGKAITLKSSEGPRTTFINGSHKGSVVTLSSGEWNTSVLTGFTIQNGGPQSGLLSGGGIYIENASPIISNNIITGNSACDGAGIFASGSPIIRNNTISGNRQEGCSGGNGGGGIALLGGSGEVVDNLIVSNLMPESRGGGISLARPEGKHTVRGNIIRNNRAGWGGGGAYLITSEESRLVQNVIFGNSSERGGGVLIDLGGTLLHNTITDNYAHIGAGISFGRNPGSGEIANNIITGGNGQTVIYSEMDASANRPLRRNVLFSSSNTIFGGSYVGYDLAGNVAADPRLSASAYGYFGLMSGSPAIDAGDSTIAGIPSTDITGSPRFVAGIAGGPAAVDAGAFEFDPSEPRVELVGIPSPVSRDSETFSITVVGDDLLSYRFAVDDGTFSEDLPADVPQLNLGNLSPGSHTVAVAGAFRTGRQRVESATVAHWTIDNAPPVTTAIPGSGTFNERQTVTLSCDDGTGSGCVETLYCLGPDCVPNTRYEGPIAVNSPTALRYYSHDAFGYAESITTASYNFTATVSGRATDSVTGAGTPLVRVNAYDAATGMYRGSAETSSTGEFLISGLPAGIYKFSFYGNGYATMWYGGSLSASGARTVVVAAPGTKSGIDAALTKGGSIAGTVTDAVSGAGVEGVNVTILDYYSVFTDSTGAYLISGLPAGKYTVQFQPPYNSPYLKGDTATVSVTAPLVAGGIDCRLKRGGAITGTVTSSTGAAMPDVHVSAIDAITGGQLTTTNTDSSGQYTLAGLPSGNYKISFTSYGYGTGWYAASSTPSGATVLSVTAPETLSGTDYVLKQGGTITGTVRDKVSGAGIANAYVSAFDIAMHGYFSGSYTDSSGAYSLSGLPSGTYLIRFSAPGYVEQWAGGTDEQGTGTSIAVAAPGTTAGVDGALTTGGSISGTIVDKKTGIPLQSICVGAYRGAELLWTSAACTDDSGRYSIDSLPSGSYRLQTYMNGQGYYDQWYTEAGTSTPRSVAVVAPNATTGMDFALEQGGVISGRVFDRETNEPLAGAAITAIGVGSSYVVSGYTDSQGAYTIISVPSGNYKVDFNASGYISRWFGDEETEGAAATVAVTAGSETAGVDAYLSRGGRISGTVSDGSTGAGVSGVQVYAIDRSTGSWEGAAYTDENGRYTITQLRSGSYRVKVDPFFGSAYLGRWYGSPCADTVSVTAPAETGGIDIPLIRGGSITGRVTDAVTGLGIRQVNISWTAGGAGYGTTIGSNYIDETGSYTLSGLLPGMYTVSFSADGYIRGTSAIATITGTEIVSGIDVALAPGARISGTLRDAVTGSPLPGIMVMAVGSTYGAGASTTFSSSSGSYTLSGLPAGEYRIYFGAGGAAAGYLRSSYADPVTVAAAESVTGVDSALHRAGALTGRVIDPLTGEPVADVAAVAHDPVTGARVAGAYSDQSGIYTIWVPSGTYSIEFPARRDSDGGYLGRWYGAETTAVQVAVEAPEVIKLADTPLSRGGAIFGRVVVNSCFAASSIAIVVYDAQTGETVTTVGVGLDYADAFSIGGLPSGRYKLFVDTGGSDFVRQWYPNSGGFEGAQEIEVRAGSVSGGIEITLESAGGIVSGTVCSGWSGNVQLRDRFSGAIVAQTSATAGAFRFTGIPDGTYSVFFSADGRLWYAAGSGDASSVVVSGAVAVPIEACPGWPLQGVPTITDVMKALRITVGSLDATPDLMEVFDIAPVVAGVSSPDGKVDISDVVILLRLAVGLPVFGPPTSGGGGSVISTGSGFVLEQVGGQ
ncbi:carboxypeptidase regulatory-like domain-containing protein [Geomonas sp. RF6]|uniref:carboxypeptidase regulatory-like domain-containing protein n=1 Tax=Geomonas sp. RF6 TaxID=2897342 RepID=UPI001E2B833B|nr:carboxypeptidase regulatory-like domain-containing protein [Geomonas sp. RF6]UFS68589.1 carboxypeptidase regulatory-like domain-containing protein [Geomonas sp. RF6]